MTRTELVQFIHATFNAMDMITPAEGSAAVVKAFDEYEAQPVSGEGTGTLRREIYHRLLRAIQALDHPVIPEQSAILEAFGALSAMNAYKADVDATLAAKEDAETLNRMRAAVIAEQDDLLRAKDAQLAELRDALTAIRQISALHNGTMGNQVWALAETALTGEKP